jgi:hypothetical protein
VSRVITVGDVAMGPTTDFVGLFRRQMLDGSIWQVFRDEGPEEGLNMAVHAVMRTYLEAAAVDAIMQLMVDPNKVVRTQAIILAQNYCTHFDSVQLLNLLRQRPALYEGVKAPGHSSEPDLAWALLRAIAGCPTKDEAILNQLRTAALDRKNGSHVLAGLTVSDPVWVLENLKELIDQEPWRASIVLNNLGSRAKRKAFARAANQSSPPGRAATVKAIREKIKDPDERTLLLSLLTTSKSRVG